VHGSYLGWVSAWEKGCDLTSDCEAAHTRDGSSTWATIAANQEATLQVTLDETLEEKQAPNCQYSQRLSPWTTRHH